MQGVLSSNGFVPSAIRREFAALPLETLNKKRKTAASRMFRLVQIGVARRLLKELDRLIDIYQKVVESPKLKRHEAAWNPTVY